MFLHLQCVINELVRKTFIHSFTDSNAFEWFCYLYWGSVYIKQHFKAFVTAFVKVGIWHLIFNKEDHDVQQLQS